MIDYEILKKSAAKLGFEVSIGDKPGFHTQDGYFPFEMFLFGNEKESLYEEKTNYFSSFIKSKDENDKKIKASISHQQDLVLGKQNPLDKGPKLSYAA